MAIEIYNKTSRAKLSRNFRVYEFACKGDGCCSTVKVDDQLVRYLQRIRDHFGKALVITSGYRCDRHNKAVGGAAGSYHVKGQAADFYVKGVKPAEVARYAESIGVKGIGLYEGKDGNFVHIDTRTTQSYWYGHKEEKRYTFGGRDYTLSMRLLHRGCTGEDVKALQILLTGRGCKGPMGEPDGKFGPNTEAAVKVFQQKNNLPQTGTADEATMKKLMGVET